MTSERAAALASVAPARRAPERLAFVDVGIVAGLLAVGVALPALLALSAHAFEIPRYDDWAYRRVLFDFADSGHLRLVGWGAMTLVGQIFWAAPFAVVLGDHAWVPGLAVALLSAIGVVAAYVLARSSLLRAGACACVLVTLAFPGLLANTSDFMTDLPGFAADAACLALGAAALGRQGRARWAWLAASAAVGCFSFSVREFGLAAPIAVLVTLGVEDRRRWRAYCVVGLCVLVVCGAIYLWAAQLPGAQHVAIGLPGMSSVRALLASYFTLCFAVSPLLPTALRRAPRPARRRGTAAALAVLAVGTVAMVRGWSLFSGNYLTQQGASGNAVLPGGRPDLFPGAAWTVLQAVALVAGTGVAFVAGSGVGRRGAGAYARGTAPTLVATFALLTAGGLVVYGLFVRLPMWDRYLWPLAFALSLLLLGGRKRGALARAPAPAAPPAGATGPAGATAHLERWAPCAVTIALAAVVAVVSGTVALNSDAYDAARWRAGQLAVAAGLAPSTVDAGFEWVGSHATAAAVPGRQLAGAPPHETWYDEMFPGFRDCAFVSGSAWEGRNLRLLRTTTYEEVGFAVPERLYLYATQVAGCRVG